MRRVVGFSLAITWTLGALAAEKPRISLELLTRPNVPLTASQQWYKTLSGLGLDGLRIRQGGASDQPSVASDGSGTARAFNVVGVLGADNVLYLRGGKFAAGDTARLRKWFDELADQGVEGVTEPRTAFGLSARQLEQVMADFRRPVGSKTRGTGCADAVRRISESLAIPVEGLATSERALSAAKVGDELQGLSSGTALAALLRPLGLSLAPRRASGGRLVYEIGPARAARESWPVGWKPKTKPHQALPELLEFLNVEIADIPVSEAIAAIEGRLKVPFLFDRNAMAAHGIDLAKVPAEVPSKRMTYSQIMHKVLNEAKLKYELRVDEADHPFIWITTIKAID
jgi:hypothetical protein